MVTAVTLRETIAAIASAPGRGAIGMLRISGADALAVAQAIVGTIPEARRAGLRAFRDEAGDILDRGLCLYFPGPNSYTGEDLVELQAHGSPVVLQCLLQAACAAGARVAEPGEFSQRAFLNGRLDLSQAEAVADLIDAASRQAAVAAQRALDGEFSALITELDQAMMDLRVWVEGALDFSDEDIDWLADARVDQRLQGLIDRLDALFLRAGRGRRLRDGLQLAIAGQPNVGKSTLLNALSGAQVAIVTDIPGTTRDLLREHLVLDGVPLTLIDTAGLRETDDPVEAEGIRRARQAVAAADGWIYLVDDRLGMSTEDLQLCSDLPQTGIRIRIHNKADLSGEPIASWQERGWTCVRLSAATGLGLEVLVAVLKEQAGLTQGTESPFIARARHLEALKVARENLATAAERIRDQVMPELAAEDIRHAQIALGQITGLVSSDQLLGEIFSRFCIGK